MPPNFADLFGRRFLEKLLFDARGDGQGVTVGRVLHELRRSFLDGGNPLAFAYTYFGDAAVALEQPLPRAQPSATQEEPV